MVQNSTLVTASVATAATAFVGKSPIAQLGPVQLAPQHIYPMIEFRPPRV